MSQTAGENMWDSDYVLSQHLQETEHSFYHRTSLLIPPDRPIRPTWQHWCHYNCKFLSSSFDEFPAATHRQLLMTMDWWSCDHDNWDGDGGETTNDNDDDDEAGCDDDIFTYEMIIGSGWCDHIWETAACLARLGGTSWPGQATTHTHPAALSYCCSPMVALLHSPAQSQLLINTLHTIFVFSLQGG